MYILLVKNSIQTKNNEFAKKNEKKVGIYFFILAETQS